MALFGVGRGEGRLKTNYLAYEDVASVIGEHPRCVERAETLLEAITDACLGIHGEPEHFARDESRSRSGCFVLRFVP